jgi:plasmid stability protein
MDATIHNLDEHAYNALRRRALLQGRTVEDLLNEAMRAYLSRVAVQQGSSTLRLLEPEMFPEGNQRLSQEIDSIVYGGGRE